MAGHGSRLKREVHLGRSGRRPVSIAELYLAEEAALLRAVQPLTAKHVERGGDRRDR